MKYLQIPIVVVAYNRVHSLRRILDSIDRAHFDVPVKLIISIDGGATDQIYALARQFHWQHGEKQVIEQAENLGLRKHIIRCGNLSQKYEGIVLLEDDLYVSPFFYHFTQLAQQTYADCKKISGIALYSPEYSENACLPFKPLNDKNDVYFMQLACSWGQSWSREQWSGFYHWYKQNSLLDLSTDPQLPNNIHYWPDTSWKKYFIKYNISNGLYFVYPRVSYSTNFGDSGENHQGTPLWQVPLAQGLVTRKMPELEESFCRYDAFYEIEAASLSHWAPELASYDLCIDLYGLRDKSSICNEYTLSRNEFLRHQMSWGCLLKPQELNVIDAIPGDHFKLSKTEHLLNHRTFLGHRYRIYSDYKQTQRYFYPLITDHYSACINDAKIAQQKADKQAKEYPTLKRFGFAYFELTIDFIRYFKNRLIGLFRRKEKPD